MRGLRAAAPVVAGIRDRALRREYTRRLAGWLGMPEPEVASAVRFAERRGARGPGPQAPGGDEEVPFQGKAPTSSRLPQSTDPVIELERQVLAVMVQFPVAAAAAGADDLDPASFSQPVHRAVFEALQAAGGTQEVPELVNQALQSGTGQHEVVGRAAIHWIEQVRAGAIASVDAALTELAVVPLPIPEPRNRAGAGEADTDAAQRLAGEAVKIGRAHV
mgnify:FL=1